MTQIPKEQIHHLQESLDEDSFRKRIPWLLLMALALIVVIVALIYAYNYRNLPKCQDESVQILLNQNIRSNEVLIQNSRTQAFQKIKEVSHNKSQRSCAATLITTNGKYSVAFLVINDLTEKSWLDRLTGGVQFSVEIININLDK